MHSLVFLVLLLAICCTWPTAASSVRPCFEALLNLTQRCDNRNFFYASIMGFGQGFGSEFNTYMIKSMIRAVLANRRFVYLDSKRPWEYNCAESAGWACYFSFPPCADSVAQPKDMDFSQRPSADELAAPGAFYGDREDMGDYYFRSNTFVGKVRQLYRKQYQGLVAKGVCSDLGEDDVAFASDFGGPAAQRLFHFNNRTAIAVNAINARYTHLSRKSYISVFMRLTDKQGEMPEEDWDLISNTTFVAHRVLEVLHNHTVKHGVANVGRVRDVYMATDDCEAGGRVLDLLLLKGFRVFGTCFHTDGRSVVADKLKGWNPRFIKDHEASTHLLIAEMDMMRKGIVFLGSIQSNIGRVLHYLRYPHYEDTYAMTPHFMSTGIDSLNIFF